jgi:hypothetical protein
MNDRLETYIQKNKHELDIYEPDDSLWQKVDRSLNPPSHKWKKFRNMAAAVVLIFASGWGLSEWNNGFASFSGSRETVSLEEQVETVQEFIDPELVKMESYYISVINQQKSQLEDYYRDGIELDEPYDDDVRDLQSIYKELQEELVYGEDKEAVVDAMMQNLLTQMNIMKEQLRILENIKKVRNEQEKHI